MAVAGILSYWKDRWILGCSVHDLVPLVAAAVPMSTQYQRTVAEALTNQQWTRDIQSGLSMVGIFELFQLVNTLVEFELGEEDTHVWRFDSSGPYTTKSAYIAFLNGAITFEPWRRIWKTWAPAKCKIFI